MKRGLVYALILLVVGTAYWLLRRHDARVDKAISSTTLAPTDQAKIIVDEKHHVITTIVRGGPVKRTFLPPHVTSVTFGKDGKVTVSARSFGTEASPFIGFTYSDNARLAVGLDLLYWHRWEVGPFIATSVSGRLSVRAGLKVSYNVYSNTSLFVGIDNQKTPTGGISFKF